MTTGHRRDGRVDILGNASDACQCEILRSVEIARHTRIL